MNSQISWTACGGDWSHINTFGERGRDFNVTISRYICSSNCTEWDREAVIERMRSIVLGT